MAAWGADGVIVGSALVKLLGEAKSPQEGLKELENLTKSLKSALPWIEFNMINSKFVILLCNNGINVNQIINNKAYMNLFYSCLRSQALVSWAAWGSESIVDEL